MNIPWKDTDKELPEVREPVWAVIARRNMGFMIVRTQIGSLTEDAKLAGLYSSVDSGKDAVRNNETLNKQADEGKIRIWRSGSGLVDENCYIEEISKEKHERNLAVLAWIPVTDVDKMFELKWFTEYFRDDSYDGIRI